MKTRTIIGLFMTFLVFSCAHEEASETTDFENQSLRAKSPIAKLLSTEEGRQGFSKLFSSDATAKNHGNGVIVIKNGADYVACGGDDNNLVCVYEIKDDFYQSPIDMKFLPNGLAQFMAKSKDFAIEIYELPSFELIYSNLCMDEFQGNLHINLLATYELISDDPFVDFDYYTFVEPASASNMQITAVVNDAARNLDIFALTWDCVAPTSEKRIKVTSLIRTNGTQNFKIHGL
ncbi:MAG: hypothetical protein KJP26_01225 [Maribacter sp.]|nr:hypothetical protein [Maribacter sp.]